LLRRYMPPSTLPTPISNGEAAIDDIGTEPSRTALPRSTDAASARGDS